MTYPNINISVLVSANSQSLTGFLKYLPKNEALLVQELSRIFFFKIRFRLLQNKGDAIKAGVAMPLRFSTFLIQNKVFKEKSVFLKYLR